MTKSELSDAEVDALIAYARRKYAEERWPLSVGLRPIREVLHKASSGQAATPSLSVVRELGRAITQAQAKREGKRNAVIVPDWRRSFAEVPKYPTLPDE